MLLDNKNAVIYGAAGAMGGAAASALTARFPLVQQRLPGVGAVPIGGADDGDRPGVEEAPHR
jgi:hypothetical protein